MGVKSLYGQSLNQINSLTVYKVMVRGNGGQKSLSMYRQKKDVTPFILTMGILKMKACTCGCIQGRWNILAILCFFLALLGRFSLWGEEIPSMSHSFKPLLDAEWKKTRSGFYWPFFKPAGVSWDYYVSPPFPAQWPPDADHRFFYYIYAMGHNPQNLSIGFHQANPASQAAY